MDERDELEQAITRLEVLRDDLGNAAVDAALAGIYQRLSALDGNETEVQPEAPKTEHTGERRLVTVLFCDVAGSTSLAESMDPEAWTGIMKAAFEYLIEPVERYGGTVARLMGDAILAFFGAPTAHEDDPQRAVLAGLAIVKNVAPYQEKLRQEEGLEFNVRVGINTGLAVVGDVGSETAGEYTAMGDAVNLAARMEQTAAPGTVQIAQETYALVAPLFECKALGGINVKGKREPVLAYQVLSRKAAPGSLRGLTDQGLSSPLVGRDEELTSARRAFDRLPSGQGGILAILGEAGIGKSRLLAELQISLAAPDTHLPWFEGQSLSYAQNISYWPFQQILRDYAGISDEDSEAAAWHKLEQRIERLFTEETAEILPYLASLLSIAVSGDYAERVKYLDGEALGRQVYRASRRFFQRLAEQRPLILVFDDLHWMDASSAGLLEHLLPLVERVPLLLCGLSRPDAESPAARLLEIAEEQYKSYLTLIELAPLSLKDSHHLVQNLLEIDSLPEQARRMMLDKADGNPFYLEEIVRDLIEAGALVRDRSTGRWQATQRIEKVAVPDTIQGLLIARIDRLEENLKRVVRRAAVIGRVFLYRVLNAVLEDDSNLEVELDQLEQVELIQEKQRLPELEYIFKHALVQEATYEGILLQERREVHAQVGAALEALMADRLDEFYSLLAYHYSAAEQWEKAQEYLFKAGDQAGRMAADAEALAHYRQAMEAYSRVRGDDWEPIEKARLERKIGEAFYRLGDFGRARTSLERALSLLGEGLPISRWGVRIAIARALLTQAVHRIFPSWFVKPMSDAPNPVAEELFNAANALGWIEGVADVERFFLISIRMLNASEKRGYAYGSTYLASSMSIAVELVGWTSLVDKYANLAFEYARHVDPHRPIYQLDWVLAFHHNINADWEKSLQFAQRATEIAKSSGDLRSWGSGMDMAAWAYHAQGKLAEAGNFSQEMIKIAEEASDLQVRCWGLLGLGVTKKRQGSIDGAINDLKKAIEVSVEIPDYHTHAAASGWLGRCYVAKGEIEQALLVLETGQKVLQAHGVIIEKAILGNGFSETYLAAADRATDKDRQEWIKRAKRSCRYTLQAAKRYRPPLMDAQFFQGRYEWLRGNSSAAQKWWSKALEEARRKGDRYEEGIVHLEIGSRLDDLSHLQQAEAILEEIGAEFDLAQTREVLSTMGEK